MILKRIPHRRLFLAGLGATALIAASTRPGHSAEIEAHTSPKMPVRRPRAEFEAARALAKAADNPAGVEAVMLRELGPLPWHFEADDVHDQLTIRELAPMADPEKPGEVTGMWAVGRRFDPKHPEKGTTLQLIQLGRLWLTLGKRVEAWEDAQGMSRLEAARVRASSANGDCERFAPPIVEYQISAFLPPLNSVVFTYNTDPEHRAMMARLYAALASA